MKYYANIKKAVNRFAQKYNVVSLQIIDSQEIFYYGGMHCDIWENMYLQYDNLRTNLCGVKLHMKAVDDVRNNIITLKDGTIIKGYIEKRYKLPGKIIKFEDIPPEIMRKSPYNDDDMIIDFHKIELTPESKALWYFIKEALFWRVNELNILLDSPLTLVLQHSIFTGVNIGIWDIKNKCYYKEPRDLLFADGLRDFILVPRHNNKMTKKEQDEIFTNMMLDFYGDKIELKDLLA